MDQAVRGGGSDLDRLREACQRLHEVLHEVADRADQLAALASEVLGHARKCLEGRPVAAVVLVALAERIALAARPGPLQRRYECDD